MYKLKFFFSIVCGLMAVLTSVEKTYSSSSSIILFSYVNEVIDIEIENYDSSFFPLDLENAFNGILADVRVFYNLNGGYDIDIQSLNGGLKDGATTTIDYDFRLTPSFSPWMAASTAQSSPVEAISNGSSPTAGTGDVYRLRLNLLANPGIPGGVYIDELTITVRAP